jgi:hypothetical protein
MVISPRVTSAGGTDFSSLRRLLASPRLAGRRGEDLAVALWQLLVDPREGVYHYCPPLERLTDHFVYDPIKMLNCFGWSICGLTANLLAVLCRAAGLDDARIAHLKEHEATEVFYGGAWHLLDADLQAFHRRHPPHEDAIAGYAECLADPTLVSRQRNPSRPYYLPDRPPERMADLYRVAPSCDRPYAVHAHTMDFVLRPGERLERHTSHEGLWIWFSNCSDFKNRWPAEWRDDGPWERHPPHRRFGNGRWVYAPDLTSASRDFEAGVLESDGLEPRRRGTVAARPGPCACTFEFDSPYVFTGTPALDGRQAPRDGCILEATVFQDAACRARIRAAVDPDLAWFTVWESAEAGRRTVRLDLTPHVVNAYRYLLRFEFDASGPESCGLEALRVASAVLVAPGSLGRLVEGTNDLAVRFGDEDGLPTRRWIVETNFRSEEDVRRKACRLENVRFVADPADRILPADAGRDYGVTFCVDAPPHGLLRRIYAFGAFRGKAPGDPTEDRVAAFLAESEDGPWRPLFASPLLEDRHRWHFAAQGEAALDRPARTAYVRFVGKVGMIDAKVRARYTDDRTAWCAAPLDVTHVWRTAGGARAEHVERVPAPGRDHRYTIRCRPEPHLESIVMQVGSVPRQAARRGALRGGAPRNGRRT